MLEEHNVVLKRDFMHNDVEYSQTEPQGHTKNEEKTLKSKCQPRTYKKKNKSFYMNLK